MVNLEVYLEEFKQQYYRKIKDRISASDRKNIVDKSKKFLPPDFYSSLSVDEFEELILAPFSKLKEAKEYIDKTSLSVMEMECFGADTSGKVDKTIRIQPFEQLYEKFRNTMNSSINKETIRVKIAQNDGKLTVCPFCNRDYINSRGKSRAGAQIDHFYPRADYPVFSLSLYNLVPVCGNCNRIKSNQSVTFVSPWDETVDWDDVVKFSYKMKAIDTYQIVIKAKGNAANNIEKMHIREAYDIHSVEVEELLEKQRFYSDTQNKEIRKVMEKLLISDRDIKRAVFGPEITVDKVGTKSLGKMMRDLHKKMGIYV